MVKIELEVHEAQMIINTLEELPHKVVHVLIEKILVQANEQLKAQEAISGADPK